MLNNRRLHCHNSILAGAVFLRRALDGLTRIVERLQF